MPLIVYTERPCTAQLIKHRTALIGGSLVLSKKLIEWAKGSYLHHKTDWVCHTDSWGGGGGGNNYYDHLHIQV